MSFLATLKQRAHQLKTETLALYLAARDPRTPWYAKLLVTGIVAYALSPIDLIPDFIPVLGYLDDLILIPIAISLAIRLVPPVVLTECRTQAEARLNNDKSIGRIAAVVIISIWVLLAAICAAWVYERLTT